MRMTKSTYTQNMHHSGPMDDDATLEIRITDAGGGEYVVINAHEFAFEKPEEIDALADAIKAKLAECVE